jgi:hypothetical protein
VNVRCLLELHLDMPNAGEIYAPETFSNRVFTQSVRPGFAVMGHTSRSAAALNH